MTKLELDALDDAVWLSRAVDPEHRQHRAMPGGALVWSVAGTRIEQPFVSQGPIVGLNFDLRFHAGQEAHGRIQLVDELGAVVAETPVAGWGVPPDRFTSFLFVEPVAPAGAYSARLVVDDGEIGWVRGETGAPVGETLPTPIEQDHRVDGVAGTGPLALGVEVPPAPNPEFLHRFDVEHDVESAQLLIGGLGEFVAYLNGARIGEAVLQPAQTDYDQRVEVRRFDVAALVRPGANELLVRTGRGFWSVRGTNVWGWNLAPYTQEPVVKAALDIRGPGGSTAIRTDESWSARASDIVKDRLFTGIEQERGGEPAHWEPALIVDGPTGRLVEEQGPTVLPAPPEVATSRTRLSVDRVVLDFDRMLAGTVELRLAGGAGAVEVRYGEYLDEQGGVVCENLLASGRTQVDLLRVLGASDEFNWRPEVGYKGFRYVELTTSGELRVESAVAVPYVADIARIGEFRCSDPGLEWLVSATMATLVNNLHGVPTDTPVYEKNGWTADAHLVAEAALHHLDLRPMLVKWLDDHVDAQDEHGSVPQIVPTPGWGTRLDPVWSASMVLLPWNLYWEYGDESDLERYIEPMTRYVDRVLEIAKSNDWIWPLHSWGDWVAPDPGPVEGPAAVGTAMVAHLASRLSSAWSVLGDAGRAERYAHASSVVGDAYHRRFFDPATDSYQVEDVPFRQVLNVLPIAFGFVPDEHREKVLAALVDDIETRTNGHLDCGALGSKHLLPVLSEGGHGDLAITVASQRSSPSWLLGMATGDGTLWETFEHTARSRDHYFLGSASHWVHGSIGGLQQLEAGWRRFRVRPPLDDRIRSAEIEHRTPLGRAAIRWSRGDGAWRVDVDVPAGASAVLSLPGYPDRELAEGSHTLEEPVV